MKGKRPFKKRPMKRKFDDRADAASRGYDSDWFKLRARHLRVEPHCRLCMAEGFEVKGNHVDHIVSIRQRPDLRLDPKNVQTLCERHHDMVTVAIDSGDLRGATDIEGNPLDPRHPWNQPDTQSAVRVSNEPFKPNFNPPEGVTRLLKRQALGARK